jgi:hypothetical protein
MYLADDFWGDVFLIKFLLAVSQDVFVEGHMM